MPYNDRIPDTPAPLGPADPPPVPPAKPPKQIAPGIFEGPDGKFYTKLPTPPEPPTR